MSDWHDELEFALLPLEDAKIDSDCMTFVISNALSEQGVFHQCRIGYAEDRLGQMATAPHCWVELEQGWCIDLRLRQWLGDEDDLPHGVFQPCNFPRVRYQGTALVVPHLDAEVLRVMTDDAYNKVKLPWLAERVRAA
ncbi:MULTISPECIES: hypothetical protein [Gammaproteobacteria]|uniref:Uncharacterized protein n=1 Tax=Idiomarina zobellii TaxID=86103 RepID=A0A837NE06_9GAMM|nr:MULTISPECIES: hypothetical protein [Gammaproteobacteria]KPD23268.1 hypothetical protein AFK76_09615 [Idiomarina zobellii]MCE7522771.1 hypothetical protein [Alloalcanivorax xenomutans]SDG05110.1 hypothetical protein SAMN04515658_1113 [Idiomarina zobellii]